MTQRGRQWLVGGLAVVALLAVAWMTLQFAQRETTPRGREQLGASAPLALSDTTAVASDLEIPWEIAWLPDDSMLVTERPGRLVRVTPNRAVIPVSGVQHTGEGGLLGLAVHPRFAETQWVYLYFTTQGRTGLENRVERYRLTKDALYDRAVIVDGIPGSSFHDGGRIAFGPDGLLYITTGDAGQESLAQDTNSLAGKVLRVRDDGLVPPDNPFGNAVYSYGHRNVQGLAWDGAGRLWATEHGRSGLQSGFDEINLIEAGGNYGWPRIQGDERVPGLRAPVLHSGASETWAPAGATILADRLFFAGLRGETLYEVPLEDGEVGELQRHFTGEFGRLRTVQVGPDGALYVTTSNRDGRGRVRAGDDQVMKIGLDILK